MSAQESIETRNRYLTEVFINYNNFVVGVAKKKLGSQELAEDAAQDVWVNALTNGSITAVPEQLGSRLGSTASSRAIDLWRRQTRKGRIYSVSLEEASEVIGGSTEDEGIMNVFLDEMTDQIQEVKNGTLILLQSTGHSLEDLSKQTGTPQGTVKNRMFHARRELRKILHHE